MSVNTTKDLSSPFFLDVALVVAWRLQPCSTVAALLKMKSTVPLATAVPSRKGHDGGGVELFKLDYRDDLWVSLYCSDDLWFFFQLLSGVFVLVEESFELELMAYNSDLRLCKENR